MQSKAFCKGLFCKKRDRRHKSVVSGKYICGLCAFKTPKGFMTIDEFVDYHIEDALENPKRHDDILKVQKPIIKPTEF